MADGIVTTSLVVNFTDPEGQGILKLEVDDRPTGLNLGNTSFTPGSSPGLLLYKSSNVTNLYKTTSEGSLSAVGNITIQKKESLTFAKVTEAELSYPCVGGFSVVRSRGVGGAHLVGETKVAIPTAGVGVVEVVYNTVAQGFRLINTVGDMPVVVYAEGEVVQ